MKTIIKKDYIKALKLAKGIMDYCSGDAWERECTYNDKQEFNKLYVKLVPKEKEKKSEPENYCKKCRRSFITKRILNEHLKTSKKHTTITIRIEAFSTSSIHKFIVCPSIVVNPSAIQYFKGIQNNYNTTSTINGIKQVDLRFKQMKSVLITCLSSDKYPNPKICSKTEASRIADEILPKLLKRLDKKNASQESNTQCVEEKVII